MSRNAEPNAGIAALVPVGNGHQFVLYGDACSGVAGALHEQTFSAVNAVVRRLTPTPEFIIFTGDHIQGLTADPELLRVQWRHWLQREMGWIDENKAIIETLTSMKLAGADLIATYFAKDAVKLIS